MVSKSSSRSQGSSRPAAWRHRRSSLVLTLLAVVVATAATFSQSGARVALAGDDDPYPNFDIRTFKDNPVWATDEGVAAFVARFQAPAALADELAAARVTGVAELEAAHKGVEIESSPALRTTEVVSAMPGSAFLTGPSDDRVAALRGFLAEHAAAYGITAAQAAELDVVADYVNPAGNMAWVEFEQRFNGIPVFQGLLRGGFTAKGELARTTGVLATVGDASALPTSPAVGAAQAVALAAEHVGWKVNEAELAAQPSATANSVTFSRASMAGEPKAWLVYFPLAEGVVRLAWATQIIGDPYGFLSVVDGETGTILFRKNLTNFQTQSASYNVYASDSPAPSSPTTALPGANFQAPYVARQTFVLIGNEAPNTFNNLGWMTDGLNETAGNNVRAGLDLVSPDGIEATVSGAARVFNFAYDPATEEPSTANYRNGEVTDMFYWTNRYHDSLYLLGFNEVARNFQNDNFGRGGAAGDRVNAEGQDYSGTNNANFLTPADGTSGRMQMYIFPGPTPDRTSGIDHDVIIHELTHGTSNRLHNNAAGLTTTMSGGMGEGWSDFYARALLSDASENVNGIYTTGGWVTNLITGGYTDNYYYGIRRFPYAVRSTVGGPMNRPHNPLTFADIDPAQVNLNDGAYPRGPIGSNTAFQVHNIGEVWANALFEVRARFITRLGFATGNQRILQFVTDGMKLDPVNPTLLQGRDAIIAAANAGGGTAADIADIWDGFATRGMGTLAAVVDASTGTVVESFLRPGDPTPTFSINDVSQAEGNAGTTTFTFTVSLANATPGVEHRVSYATADGTATGSGTTTTFTANTATTIPAGAPGTTSGPASPYPLNLAVSGLTGNVTNVAVRVEGLTHTFPGDLDLLLVGPGGQTSMFMSDIGGGADVSGVDLTFQDGAPAPPGTLVTGTYAPTNIGAGDTMPAPAPAGAHGTPLSVFNGTNPNGTWQLYVNDDAGGDFGSMTGYSLIITVPSASADYQAASGQLIFPAGTTSQPVNITVNGDVAPEPNETFFVNLSSPINAVIGDGQGVGTILDDDAVATVQPPTNLLVDSVVGTTVTLRWTPPAIGPAPSGYILEGGVNPGEVLASIPTGSASAVFTFVAPSGSFFIRMHSALGADRSGASNEIPLFVNVPVAPSAPANLLGLVNGSSLALAWKNTYAGGPPTGLVLDVTGAIVTSIPLGLSDSFQFAGVPAGTYNLSLRATNAGGASGPSNTVSLTFPGACSGVPQAPSNFIGYRIGNTAFAMWDSPTSGAAPTSYVLNVTGSFVGSFATAGRALSGVIAPGTYNLTVQSVNACGTSAPSPVQVVTLP